MIPIPRHADATLAARVAPIQAAPDADAITHARALLRACPVPAASLRMWRAAMPTACQRWGWAPLLETLIAAAEANERAAHPHPGPRA